MSAPKKPNKKGAAPASKGGSKPAPKPAGKEAAPAKAEAPKAAPAPEAAPPPAAPPAGKAAKAAKPEAPKAAAATIAVGEPSPNQQHRAFRRKLVGRVTSNKMAKTIVVRVERRFPHPRFSKVVTAYKKFYAHDEKGEAKVGDQVRIEETRPLSATKRWRLVEVVEKGSGVARVAA